MKKIKFIRYYNRYKLIRYNIRITKAGFEEIFKKRKEIVA